MRNVLLTIEISITFGSEAKTEVDRLKNRIIEKISGIKEYINLFFMLSVILPRKYLVVNR